MMVHIRTAVLASLLFVLVPVASFAGSGVLEVRSAPSGARVTIDDVEVGTTPYQNIEMPTGKHQIKAVLGPEYPPLIQEVDINELAPQVIMFKFVKQRKGTFVGQETVLTTETYTGNVIFVSMPTGAVVIVDGLPRKSTPIGYTDIDVGKYSVKFILGKRILHSSFEVVQGETIKVVADFSKGKVFNTAKDAKKSAAKKGVKNREIASSAGAGQMTPSPERATMETAAAEETESELETMETGTAETAAAPDGMTTTGTEMSETAAPIITTAGTATAETAAPVMMSTGTSTPETAPPPAVAPPAGSANNERAVMAMQTPQPLTMLSTDTKTQAASSTVMPPTGIGAAPFGELAITVNVNREAGFKYSDYFILSFPKIPIESLSGQLFPDASKIDQSVQRDNFEYMNDADTDKRWFTAKVHFDPRMTVRAAGWALSDTLTVGEGKYELAITRRRILKHFVPDEKLMDETAREELEIVRGKKLLVQINGLIGADNKLNYDIKRTYEPLGKSNKTDLEPEKKSEKTDLGAKNTSPERSNQSPMYFLNGGQD